MTTERGPRGGRGAPLLLSCGVGFLLLSLSTAVAMVAGFSAGITRGAEAIFVLALVSAMSAVILIVLDLLIAFLTAADAAAESDEERRELSTGGSTGSAR